MQHAGTPYPITCAFLEELGLDPKAVLVDGLNEHAYREVLLDEDGARVMHGGHIQVRGRSWPSARAGRLVVLLMRLEER